MKRLAWVCVASLALVLGACAGQQAQPPAQNQQPAGGGAGGVAFDAAAAESKYKATCAGCHGNDLQGQVGPKLSDVGARYNKDQILDILKNGKGSMPGNLVSGQEAENLAAWLAAKK